MTSNIYLATDKDKVTGNENLIFDRVINLKFNCLNRITGETYTFVVRSDFEMFYPSMSVDKVFQSGAMLKKDFRFRKCQYKPSIKIQYKKVSGGTNVELDLFVSNFFIVDSDGNQLVSFTKEGFDITSIEIMMGYFNQFAKVFNPETATLDDYMDFTPTKNIDKIYMNEVYSITMEKLPPNSMLHIHGWVGSETSNAVDADREKPTFAVVNDDEYTYNVSGKKYKDILFNAITCRYLRQGWSRESRNKDNIIINNGRTSNSLILDKDHTMKKSDAEAYGIKVELSEGVKDAEVPKIKDGEGKLVEQKLNIKSGRTVKDTFEVLRTQLNQNIRYAVKNDGSIFVYLMSELLDSQNNATSAMVELSELADANANNYFRFHNNYIPAVTNINLGAVCMIVCPFFGFLEPFQTVRFASRYKLTSLTSYFVEPTLKTYDFMSLSISISFATVEDVNEMTIKAVPKPKA